RQGRPRGRGTLTRPRGRPPSEKPKQQVSLRLDPDVLEGIKATGAGWQRRVNDALRAWLKQRGKDAA
ncbi:MAG: BrnA antitoxin family protein, partial [Bacteroidales bacterium]|nr:BrnA antitoxin family protein [Bacteroidales bacterium]